MDYYHPNYPREFYKNKKRTVGATKNEEDANLTLIDRRMGKEKHANVRLLPLKVQNVIECPGPLQCKKKNEILH